MIKITKTNLISKNFNIKIFIKFLEKFEQKKYKGSFDINGCDSYKFVDHLFDHSFSKLISLEYLKYRLKSGDVYKFKDIDQDKKFTESMALNYIKKNKNKDFMIADYQNYFFENSNIKNSLYYNLYLNMIYRGIIFNKISKYLKGKFITEVWKENQIKGHENFSVFTLLECLFNKKFYLLQFFIQEEHNNEFLLKKIFANKPSSKDLEKIIGHKIGYTKKKDKNRPLANNMLFNEKESTILKMNNEELHIENS